MRLALYFHEHTKDNRGAMDVHIIKTHDGVVTLDSKLRGDPQSVIETVEAIWGPDWHDGIWESNYATA
jgi:hypothetical protein